MSEYNQYGTITTNQHTILNSARLHKLIVDSIEQSENRFAISLIGDDWACTLSTYDYCGVEGCGCARNLAIGLLAAIDNIPTCPQTCTYNAFDLACELIRLFRKEQTQKP